MNLTDVNAERSLIGCIVCGEGTQDYLLDTVSEHDFSDTDLRAVYKALRRLKREGVPVDQVTLLSASQDEGSSLRGVQLSDMIDDAEWRLENSQHYGNILKEKSALRRIKRLSHSIEVGLDQGLGPQRILGEVIEEAEQIRIRGGASEAVNAGDLALAAMAELEGSTPIEVPVLSGLPSVDAISRGSLPQDYVVVGARTSVGKSAFGVSLTLAALEQGFSVDFFSLEMSKRQIWHRLASDACNIDLTQWSDKDRPLVGEQLVRVSRFWRRFSQFRFGVDDTPALRIDELCARAKKQHAKHGTNVFIVDYIGKVRGSEGLKYSTREREIADISSKLQALARQTNSVVVALCQLGRGAATRQDARPVLTDLRESGRIEEDANQVFLLHRDEDSDAECKREVIVAKNRNGPVGRTEVRYVPKYAQFGRQLRPAQLDVTEKARAAEDDIRRAEELFEALGRDKGAAK